MALLKDIESAIARSRDGQHYSSPELVGLLERAAGELRETERQYMELIYAVASKFPNETRHQTALRYIRRMEEPSITAAQVARRLPG